MNNLEIITRAYRIFRIFIKTVMNTFFDKSSLRFSFPYTFNNYSFFTTHVYNEMESYNILFTADSYHY